MAVKVAWVGGLAGEEDCHGRLQFVVSVVQMLWFIGCMVVWREKGVGSGERHYDSADFFAAVAIWWDMWEWRLGDL